MSLYLGRAGKTLALPEPMRWEAQGRTVRLSGNLSITSPVSDALRLRDQILGYDGNFDEEIIPVIVDGEPRLTGYYRVLSVQAPTDPAMISRGLGFFTVTLESIPGFTQPVFESIITGALFTPNGVGAVTGDMQTLHAVPAAATEYFLSLTGTFFLRSSADGSLQLMTTAPASGIAHFYVAPASYYVGAGTFEQGSVLQPVVGRQLVQNDTSNWRLSNGLVRVTPNATPGKLDVSHWKGAAWAAAKTYKFTLTTAGLVNGFPVIRVLRNSPEETIIRLGCSVAYGITWGRVYMDLALRRGDRLVRGYLSTDTAAGFSIARDTAEAATAITYGAVTLGGIRASANDADGNRYVLLSYGTASPVSDLVNGKISQNLTTNLTFDFGIGSEIGGSGATTPPDGATDIAKQYLAMQSEKQQVVSR